MNIKQKELAIPLIQGGMGIGVSLGNLAGHVARCGAMGVISAANPGYREADFWQNSVLANIRALQKEIVKAKEISGGNGLVAMNIMVAGNRYADMIKAAVESKIDCIISGAGLPTELPSLVRESDVAIAPIVSSGKAAKVICSLWDKRHGCVPDFIVLEGPCAGGHLGFTPEELLCGTAKGLSELLKEVLAALLSFEEKYGRSIPVFAAGGICSAQDVQNYMNAGASGVQVATRFIATQECDASEQYKRIIVSANEKDIEIVKSPVGMPGRAMLTPLIEKIRRGERVAPSRCANCLTACNPSSTPYCITNALIEAVKGNYEEGLFFCGSNAFHLNKITSVREVIDELMVSLKTSAKGLI